MTQIFKPSLKLFMHFFFMLHIYTREFCIENNLGMWRILLFDNKHDVNDLAMQL